jgi:hypothetical protein
MHEMGLNFWIWILLLKPHDSFAAMMVIICEFAVMLKLPMHKNPSPCHVPQLIYAVINRHPPSDEYKKGFNLLIWKYYAGALTNYCDVERPKKALKTPLTSLQSSQIYNEKLALPWCNGSVMYCVLKLCFLREVTKNCHQRLKGFTQPRVRQVKKKGRNAVNTLIYS